jgi:hypothetical protein
LGSAPALIDAAGALRHRRGIISWLRSISD